MAWSRATTGSETAALRGLEPQWLRPPWNRRQFSGSSSGLRRKQWLRPNGWPICTPADASPLAADGARLGARAVRYAFTAVDWRHHLLAGLPAHCRRNARNTRLRTTSLKIKLANQLRNWLHDQHY